MSDIYRLLILEINAYKCLLDHTDSSSLILGKQQLHFETEGSGIVSWGLLKNPNQGEKGAFKSTLME